MDNREVRRIPPSAALPSRPAIPAWALSLLLHVCVLSLLILTIRSTPRQGTETEQVAEVGIALKYRDGEQQYYETEDDTDVASPNAVASVATSMSREELLEDQPPVDPTDVLPKSVGIIGPSALETGSVGNAGDATGGPRPRKGPRGGGVQTQLFGIQGEGYKFVYVFDRSGSMGGSSRSALNAAKAELLASIEPLDSNHQFQIIFYNERPVIFNPSGQNGRLAFGNERNKNLARRFIRSITADGATRHVEALMLAIKMRPDVIFFLTDADEPQLSLRELDKIQNAAAGIVINSIEFGFGPQSRSNNFLQKLANKNNGQHVYVDISKLRR